MGRGLDQETLRPSTILVGVSLDEGSSSQTSSTDLVSDPGESRVHRCIASRQPRVHPEWLHQHAGHDGACCLPRLRSGCPNDHQTEEFPECMGYATVTQPQLDRSRATLGERSRTAWLGTLPARGYPRKAQTRLNRC